MAVDARLRCWNRGVGRFVDGIVTVAAIHFELARMESVTKGNGLLRSIARVEGNRASRAEEQHAGVSPTPCDQHAEQSQELIGPPWEQESLHGHTVSFL